MSEETKVDDGGCAFIGYYSIRNPLGMKTDGVPTLETVSSPGMSLRTPMKIGFA